MSGKLNKQRDLLSFGLLLAVVLAVNMLVSSVVLRLDLTAEKRYTWPILPKSFFPGWTNPSSRVFICRAI